MTTLVVETGAGLPNANSYDTVENVEAYLADHRPGPAWNGVQATVALTMDTKPTDTDPCVVGTKTYTFQTTLTNVDGNVLIGETLADSQANLKAAVNRGPGAGVVYAAAMTANGDANVTTIAANVITFEAHLYGAVGNAIVSTETFTAVTNVFATATFSGGVEATLTDNRKRQACVKGTSFMDRKYGARWRGTKANEEADQARDWPRDGVRLEGDRYALDSDEMPQDLLDGLAEVCYLDTTETAGLMPDVAEPGLIKRDKAKVGSLETDITYAGGKSQVKKFTTVDAILRKLLTPTNQLVRG